MVDCNFFSAHIPIDLIPVNVAIYRYIDNDFIFIDINKTAQQTEKITKNEVIGKPLSEIFPGVKEFGLFEVLLRVHKKGGDEDVDLGFYEDERIQGWRKNRVFKLENGDVAAMYSDFTAQKEVQNKLQSFGKIIDESSNEIYIFDSQNKKFLYVNKQVERNTGYTAQEMLEMTPVDLKPEYTTQSFSALMEPLINGSKEYLLFETKHQRKDGSQYDVEIRVQCSNVENKQQFVVFANDISERKRAEIQLRQSEDKFRKITENSLMGIFIYQDYILYSNDVFASMVGYSIEELLRMEVWSIFPLYEQQKYKNIVKRRLEGENFSKEYNDIKVMTKNAKVKTIRVITQTIPYNDSYAGICTVMDITDINDAKQQLKLLAQAIEQTDSLIRITDKNGIITYVNDSLVAHTGYKQVELLGKKIGMFKSGRHDKAFYKELWSTILAGKTYRGVFINKKKDKTIYYEEETITPMMDNEGEIQHFIATSQDITGRVKMEKKLQRLANTDSLTGLYNRYRMNEELKKEIDRASRYNNTFALIMIDIDYFKTVNDTYGHDVGDYVLRELSNILSKLIRESDCFGRWGGEEFLIIAPTINQEQLIKFANKLKEAIAANTFNYVSSLTISVGATLFHKNDRKETVLKRVDEALYHSKKEGRNRVSFL